LQQTSARVSPLPKPAATAIVGALLVCAAVAWYATIRQAGSMGMGSLAMMGAGLFLITWLVMMVAMMFPSVAPMTLAFASVTRSRGEGSLPTAAFVLGYLVVWTAVGLVPLAILLVANQVWMTPPSWLPRAGGAVVILAGIYQFTPLKDTCLRACRAPLGFILSHNFGGGVPAAARAGASHGLYCLGCCWALMAVLAVLGLMNIAWMAVIAAVFFVEKNVRRGDLLPRVVGAACVAGGLAIVVWPALITGSSSM
jgi:predicted metal-binding membrane protein